jgi:hypothetical protein
MLDAANLRVLRNMLVHPGDGEILERVMSAWAMGAQDVLIATATVTEDGLFVLACSMESFHVRFDGIPALKRLPADERAGFRIDPDGSRLHWPESDVHLDLDTFRYFTDPEFREREDRRTLMANRRFGASVAAVRRKAGLRQSDIPDLSARQIARIEAGAMPRVASLEALARAHGLDLDEYLNQLAMAVDA